MYFMSIFIFLCFCYILTCNYISSPSSQLVVVVAIAKCKSYVFGIIYPPCVKRILVFLHWLQDLIDNTPPDHEDFESLNMALDTVRKLATAVDESKNLADNARKDEQALKELEGLIDGVDLVSPHRKFVRQYAITEMVSCC